VRGRNGRVGRERLQFTDQGCTGLGEPLVVVRLAFESWVWLHRLDDSPNKYVSLGLSDCKDDLCVVPRKAVPAADVSCLGRACECDLEIEVGSVWSADEIVPSPRFHGGIEFIVGSVGCAVADINCNTIPAGVRDEDLLCGTDLRRNRSSGRGAILRSCLRDCATTRKQA
jgi:hypothetical protein